MRDLKVKRRTAIVVLALIAFLASAMLVFGGSGARDIVRAEAGEVRNVVVVTDGGAAESDYFVSMEGGLLFAAGLGYEGEPNSRLVGTDGNIVYIIDMEDDITSAELTVMAKGLKAEYSLTGDSYEALSLTETPENSATHEVIWKYSLTEENALGGTDNSFYLKFTNGSGADGFIHGFAVSADNTVNEDVNYNAIEGLRHIADTDNCIVYFVGGVPCVYSMSAESSLICKFDLTDQDVSGIIPSVNASGGEITEYSYDKSEWETYTPGATIGLGNGQSTLYFKVGFSAGDKYVAGFGVSLKKDYSGLGEKQVFFRADGGAEEAKYLKSADGLLFATGLGWAGSANSRLCASQGSIVYFIDLSDDISEATLKYTAMGFEAYYSLDGSEYEPLQPSHTAGYHGTAETVYTYELTRDDALSAVENDWNRFYIKLTNKSASDGYLHNLAIVSETQPLTDEMSFSTADEGLKYYDSGKSMLYFADGQDATTQSVYCAAGDYAVYAFALESSKESYELNLSCATSENFKTEYSFDKNDWTEFNGKTEIAAHDEEKTVYFRFTALTESLLGAVTLSKTTNGSSETAQNEKSVSFYISGAQSDEKYLVSESNVVLGAAGLGMLADKNAKLITPDSGEIVYRFDMDDAAEYASLKLVGRYLNVSYSTSADGEYTALQPRENPKYWENHAVIFNYDLDATNVFADNAGNVFFLKIKGGVSSYEGWFFGLSLVADVFSYGKDVALKGISVMGIVEKFDGFMYGNPSENTVAEGYSLYFTANDEALFKVKFDKEVILGLSVSFSTLNGNEYEISCSTDGETYSPYTPGQAVDLGESDTFYLKMINLGGDDLLMGINFLTQQKELDYDDLESQEGKDFGYGNTDGEIKDFEKLPDAEDGTTESDMDTPAWFGEEGGCSGNIGTLYPFAAILLFAAALMLTVILIKGRKQR